VIGATYSVNTPVESMRCLDFRLNFDDSAIVADRTPVGHAARKDLHLAARTDALDYTLYTLTSLWMCGRPVLTKENSLSL
jgi:hypothetical protein